MPRSVNCLDESRARVPCRYLNDGDASAKQRARRTIVNGFWGEKRESGVTQALAARGLQRLAGVDDIHEPRFGKRIDALVKARCSK